MPDDVISRSSLSWLDFSEHERRKALDVIDMFRDRGTVDELGLGTVRDALANVLFPGTSTIQTRARYFLFVPWIYRELEGREGATTDVASRARKLEIRLIQALVDSGERDGVIGIDARDDLKRLPSNVYWQGLQIWGIREANITQAEYHRNFSRFGRRRAIQDDGDLGTTRSADIWHANLPEAPDSFLQSTKLQLTRPEAEYLRDRLMLNVGDSYLAWLVDSGRPSQVEFPWLHPQLASVPEHIAVQLEHARKFSLAVQGAALAYNLYVAELLNSDERIATYEEKIERWADEVEKSREELRLWSRDEFWSLVRKANPRLGYPTQTFVDRWLSQLLATTAGLTMVRHAEIRQLIERREVALKKKLARLVNQEARSRWRGDSGTGRLDFRWFRTQVIVNDILGGQANA